MPTREITVYVDYKSPYAYLVVAPACSLEVEYDVRLNWLPPTSCRSRSTSAASRRGTTTSGGACATPTWTRGGWPTGAG
jgi:hypothetical protein